MKDVHMILTDSNTWLNQRLLLTRPIHTLIRTRTWLAIDYTDWFKSLRLPSGDGTKGLKQQSFCSQQCNAYDFGFTTWVYYEKTLWIVVTTSLNEHETFIDYQIPLIWEITTVKSSWNQHYLCRFVKFTDQPFWMFKKVLIACFNPFVVLKTTFSTEWHDIVSTSITKVLLYSPG